MSGPGTYGVGRPQGPAATILDDHHIALAFSPDSRRFIARYAGNEYRLCELPSGKEIRRFVFPGPTDDLSGIFWNPCKPQIAIAHRTGWRIADLETGEQQAECPVRARIGYAGWHPDGRHLAVGVDRPAEIEIYDTRTRRMVARQRVGDGPAGLVPTFNHAGDLLITNDWSGIRRIWDPACGTELLHMAASSRNFFLVSPDDRRAAFNVEGQDLQTMSIAAGAERTFAAAPREGVLMGGRAPQTPPLAARIQEPGSVNPSQPPLAAGGAANDYGEEIAPSPDGRLLAVASSAGVSLVDPKTGFELAVVPDRGPIRFDSAGALLTWGNFGFRRWPIELKSEGRVAVVKAPQIILDRIKANSNCSASADGTVVAMAISFTNSGTAVLRQARPGGEVRQTIAGPQADVRHVAVSPDGKWVAAGCFSPAAEKLTNAKVWDTSTGTLQATLPVSEGVWVWFSPQGTWLATLSRTDAECRLWRTVNWEAGPRFPAASEVAFSPDERILAVGSRTGQIRLCETSTGREFAIVPAAAGVPVYPRAFSPDGTRLYGKVEWDTKVHVWDLRQIREGLRELGLDQGWPDFPERQAADLGAPEPLIVEAGVGSRAVKGFFAQ